MMMMIYIDDVKELQTDRTERCIRMANAYPVSKCLKIIKNHFNRKKIVYLFPTECIATNFFEEKVFFIRKFFLKRENNF